MSTTIEATPELLTAIRNLNDAYKEFATTNPVGSFDVHPIFHANSELCSAVPKEIYANAEKYYNSDFVMNTAYFDKSDIEFDMTNVEPEIIYHGLALAVFNVIVDVFTLSAPITFAGFASRVEALGNSMADLIVYHPNFDVETGQWNN